MTVLPQTGPNPLPPQNFRHGHPTPQTGVEVERKWKRADYTLPGTNRERPPRPDRNQEGLTRLKLNIAMHEKVL